MAAAATTLQPVVIVAPSRVPRGFMPAMTASGQFRVRTDDSIAPSLIIPSAVSVACVVAAEDQWLVHVHREKLLENCTRVCKTFQQSFLLCIISTELGRQLLLEFQSKNLRSLPQVVMCKSVDDVPKVVACLVRAFRGETSASRERRVKQVLIIIILPRLKHVPLCVCLPAIRITFRATCSARSPVKHAGRRPTGNGIASRLSRIHQAHIASDARGDD